jgi:8-amino-7-oxononanoate synthase
MDSLDAFAVAKLARLESQALRRELTQTERLGEALVLRRGRRLISFSCNDYLGLAQDARVKAAAVAAIERYGAGAAASRLVTGDHPLLRELESALAQFKAAPAALVFGSGYLANLGAPPALVGDGDLILLDELSHACMYAGARLSRAKVLAFQHNDPAHLTRLLASERAGAARALILTETVFSMDGDCAPLKEIAEAAERFDAWLMTDDAHGIGLAASSVRAPLQMGTLSKSLGSYGGYLCASQPVVDLMKSRARSFVYTTGLPPACAASALAALRILQSEPQRGARALALARQFARRLGLPQAQSAIVPVRVGEAQEALRLSAELERLGFLVVAIRPPTVPPGSARLRVAFSAAHSERQVDDLADALLRLRGQFEAGAA